MNKLNRTLWTLLAVAVLVLPLAACEREEGPMEEMGESLDGAVDDLKDKMDEMGDKLEDAADETDEKIEETGEELEEAGEELEEAVEGDG